MMTINTAQGSWVRLGSRPGSANREVRLRWQSSFLVVALLLFATATAYSDHGVENAFPNLSFVRPLDIRHAKDGSNRLFVAEQRGTVYVFDNDPSVLSKQLVIDLSEKVTVGGQSGFLGIEVHPEYASNGFLFVNYTTSNPFRTIVERYTTDLETGVADRDSRRLILEIEQPSDLNNGGGMAFGPDGFLYLGLGDGGPAFDPFGNGQNRQTLFGSILRIDVDESNLFVEKIQFQSTFALPYGTAFDPEFEFLYISDCTRSEIKKFTLEGELVLSWGEAGDGEGQLATPADVTVNSAGEVLVSEERNHRYQKFTADGGYLGTFGSLGTAEGQFAYPLGITTDSQDNIFVVDYGNNRIQKFDSSGEFLVSWGQFGTGEGEFNGPYYIEIDSHDLVYVVDRGNNRVQKFTNDGMFLSTWGGLGSGDGEFDQPHEIAIDLDDHVYVADSANNRVQGFTSEGEFLFSWTPPQAFDAPKAIGVDREKSIYVAEVGAQRILRKFTRSATWEKGVNYGIPRSNPFVGNTDGYREEIFAYGFRNPWRFSFDPETGDFWVGDVGEKQSEEIDLVLPGENYGWNILEGNDCNPLVVCDPAGLASPVWTYDENLGLSVIGGLVYRGSEMPSLIGSYIFGDFSFGTVWGLTMAGDGGQVTTTSLVEVGENYLTSFGVDQNGEVFITSLEGIIYRLREFLTGDFNRDRIVDFLDFFLFVDAFGQFATGDLEQFDLQRDGVVDFFDLFVFVDNFNRSL